MGEIVIDFYDKLKSVSRGYASFDYHPAGFRESKLVKLDILLNGESVDALSTLTHVDNAVTLGRRMCERLKELLPRQQFDIAINNDAIRPPAQLVQVKVPVKTTKEVPLEIIVRESAGSTLEQTKYTISPRSVTLAGEKEVLDGISAITLDTVYLQDISQSQTMYYEIIAPENTEIVSNIKNATVKFTVTGVMEKTFTVSRFLVERVKEGFTGQCVTESIQVTLRGLAAEINAITGEEIVAVIDFSSLSSAGEYTLPVNIVVSGYENVSAKGNYQVNVRLDTNGTIESERTGT